MEIFFVLQPKDFPCSGESFKMVWAGHAARMEKINAYKNLLLRLKRRYHTEDRQRWEDDVKMDVKDMELECGDWINVP